MSKGMETVGASLVLGGAFIVNPGAAIGAAIGCCFFLAVPWGAGRLAWWRRILLAVFSYGIGYASGAYLFGTAEPDGAMMGAGCVSALAATVFAGLNRAANNDGPLPSWLSQILDRLPVLKRGEKDDG